MRLDKIVRSLNDDIQLSYEFDTCVGVTSELANCVSWTKPVSSLYWYSAWRCGANCQAEVTNTGKHWMRGVCRPWGFRQAIHVDRENLRHLAPGGTRPSPDDLKVGSAWHVMSSARLFCGSSIGLMALCAWSTRLLWHFKARLAGVPWVVAQNVSLELSLG